jgi:predicted  nucleic acid-binding Zn-ribbon protein
MTKYCILAIIFFVQVAAAQTESVQLDTIMNANASRKQSLKDIKKQADSVSSNVHARYDSIEKHFSKWGTEHHKINQKADSLKALINPGKVLTKAMDSVKSKADSLGIKI